MRVARDVPSAGDDDSDEAPARVALAAVREEPLRFAARAAGDVVDRAVVDAERDELRAYGCAQIHECLVPHAADDVTDAFGHVLTDLEAARTDRGPDRGDDAAYVPRAWCDAFDGGGNDARLDPAPSRVDRGHAACAPIDEEHRDAIGDANGDGCLGPCLTDDRVGLLAKECRWIACGGRHGATVYLLRLEEARAIEPDGAGELVLIRSEPHGIAERREVARFARREGMTEALAGQRGRGEDPRHHDGDSTGFPRRYRIVVSP